MSRLRLAASALLGAALLATPVLSARAEDPAPASRPAARTGVVTLGDGAVRFRGRLDPATGRLLLRLADRNARLASAPVAVIRSATGAREVALVPVENEAGAWVLTDDLLRGERFDGLLRVVSDGRTLEGPLVLVAEASRVPLPRHGGRMLSFEGCGLFLEALQDRDTGLLTLFPTGLEFEKPPQVAIREGGGVTLLQANKVQGRDEWRVTSKAFTAPMTVARIRIWLDGKSCETFLTEPPHGGTILMVQDGPQVEIVRTGKGVRIFVLEETVGDARVVVEEPALVVTTAEGPRTIALVPVEGQPLAWEVAELPAGTSTEGMVLRMTLSGRRVDTDLAPVFPGEPR